jgi:putative ABC transport system permease protein
LKAERGLLGLALILARRELRAGLAGFRIFLACLALGAAALAGIGSTTAALVAGLDANARQMLGGDAEFRTAQRNLAPEAVRWLQSRGTISEVRQLRGMLRRVDDTARTLIELKAVDGAYPLVGTVGITPPLSLADALRVEDGVPGILVDPLVLDRLRLKPGDMAVLASGKVRIAGALTAEPDAVAGAFSLGPHVLIATQGLAATGLDLPGTLSTDDYRILLGTGADPVQFIATANAAFPDIGWQTRDPAHAAPGLDSFIAHTAMFLALVGLTALLAGGLGVANAVSGYLDAKRGVIATLRCLGASTRLIYATYLLQIMALALLGVAAGVAVGATMPWLVAWWAGGLLPVPLKLAIYPIPLMLAAAFGVLVAAGFSLLPLAAARGFSPASLFRQAIATDSPKLARGDYLAVAALGLGISAMALVTSSDKRLAAWFLVASLLCFGLFYTTGLLVKWASRRVARPRLPWLRLALANLHRPHAPTPVLVTSLGLGLTVLIAVSLVEAALTREIGGRLSSEAPSFFMIDIQPDQEAAFSTLVRGMPGTDNFDSVPSLRARISRINGVPASEAKVDTDQRGLIESERGLTYAATIPAGSTVVAGSWWAADYHGPPLVSLDQSLARGLHLKLGDTLTVNVAGREITARLANTRRIDWSNLGINFFTVFAPGTLEPAPQTRIAAVRVATPGEEEQLSRSVNDRFPNISVVRVREELERIGRLLAGLATAIRAVASISVLAGGLVLAGAVASGHRRRLYDTVILKVLGATRATIARGLVLEYGLLGLVTAVIASGFGTAAAWLLVTYALRVDWSLDLWRVVGTAGGGIAITILIAMAASFRAVRGRPAAMLRNE